jgi:hypothetical protein
MEGDIISQRQAAKVRKLFERDYKPPAIVYLRDAHKGEGDECWVPCAKGDPGAFAFIQQV